MPDVTPDLHMAFLGIIVPNVHVSHASAAGADATANNNTIHTKDLLMKTLLLDNFSRRSPERILTYIDRFPLACAE
jgi:hypothetical protein